RLDSTSRAQVYFPFYQDPTMFNMSLAVRTTEGNPLALGARVRAAILSVDRNQPVFYVRTLGQIVADSIAPRRFALLLFSVFAVVALLLAAAGIYGVMAYSVTERTHEIGIRIALGAQTGDVVKLVLRQGLTLTCCGIALGTLAAMGLTRLLKNLLFDISATDPLTFGCVAAVLVVIALLACYLPARRAAHLDPLIAIHYDRDSR